MTASMRMSAASTRSRSAAVPMTEPTAAQAFSGAVSMATATGSATTGACNPRGFAFKGPRSSAESGAR